MSIAAINHVVSILPDEISSTQRLVLLVMANRANEAGECHPSVALLTRETSLSERAVQNALRELKAAGRLAMRGWRGQTPVYVLTFAAGAVATAPPAPDAPPHEMHPAPPAGVHVLHPAPDAPPQEMHPAGDAVEGCTSCGEGVHLLREGGAPDAPKPPRTTIEPPEDHHEGTRAPAGRPDLVPGAAEIWNEVCAPILPAIRSMPSARAGHLRRRLAGEFHGSLDEWRAFCRQIVASPILTGAGRSDWKATIDWAVNPSNVAKVLEGNYPPAPTGSAPPRPATISRGGHTAMDRLRERRAAREMA